MRSSASKAIALIQPRHIYASSDASSVRGHVYFPASLFFIAARLRAVGAEVSIYDENIGIWDGTEETAGIANIGSPYVFPIQNRITSLERAGVRQIMVGGQGTRGLSSSEFRALFGDGVISGTLDEELVSGGIVDSMPPTQETVSIAGELARLSDERFLEYFCKEAPFYLSQGCRFSCTFCGAERADPSRGHVVRERYRNMDCVRRDLEFIVSRSRKLGLNENRFYLSNLDLFQSPQKLNDFTRSVKDVLCSHPGHRIRMRGLATSTSFQTLANRNPSVIHELVDAGLEQVGFGIDGATPDVWKAIRKPHSKNDCLDAVALSYEEFSLVPETLMVFGHDGHDSKESLGLAVDTVRYLSEHYGAIPRPHVAKGIIPGNDGWVDASGQVAKQFLFNNPWAFQFLDFTCLPTDLTHPDPGFRKEVSNAFLKICEMDNCLTQYVLPEDYRSPAQQREAAKNFNEGRFDI